MVVVYIALIIAALVGAAMLFFKGVPTIASFFSKRAEVKRKHEERLAIIAQTKDVLTLLTYNEELGQKVRIGLNRHYEGEPNWWLDEGEEALKKNTPRSWEI